MNFYEEYINIAYNTYSHEDYITGLQKLKTNINDEKHPISLIISGDFSRMNSDFLSCKNFYEKAYNLHKNDPLLCCKMLEILDFLEEENLIDSQYYEVIKYMDDIPHLVLKIDSYIGTNKIFMEKFTPK